jgi:hypothetical protein
MMSELQRSFSVKLNKRMSVTGTEQAGCDLGNCQVSYITESSRPPWNFFQFSSKFICLSSKESETL